MAEASAAIPLELIEAIVRGRCALLLGPDAGESAGGYRGLPTSWQLADELATRCGYRGGYHPLPQIAQVYQHTLGRNDLIRYLRGRLQDDALAPLPIHQVIARMPFTVIVHAGWDTLLEDAYLTLKVPHKRVVSSMDAIYSEPPKQVIVYKPYGSIDRPDETLAITEDDQLKVFYGATGLESDLELVIRNHHLLLVGYAPDFDSLFVRIHYKVRSRLLAHTLRSFVLEPSGRTEDIMQWESRDIDPIVAEPVTFLYALAEAVAAETGQPLGLPALDSLSQAPPVTEADLMQQTDVLNRVLDKLGVSDLVEQTDVPLLSPEQVRDLEAMRHAYERLTETLEPVASTGQVWLRQGNVEYARQNYDRARELYDRSLAADPTVAEAYHNLHYVYLIQGALSAALDAYRKAISLKPELAILPSRYRIDAVLGRGGIGTVYRAVDQQTNQVVAVKLLDRAFMRTEQALRRFQREAEILQRLEHPHIVRYVDYQHYQGRHFLVMEYLGAQTLATLLADRTRLPIDEANEIFQQVCQAVAYAHSQQIVHRDIKPTNIFLQEGQVKLIDFGLAADLAAGQPSVLGQATGTVSYMAPEQVMGGPIDQRTDVYALGSVFYEMLVGWPAGQGAYRAPSTLRMGFNDALDIVLEKATDREPGRRYPSASSLAQEIDRVVLTQPASVKAPIWQRALARFQAGLGRAMSSYWWVIVGLVALIGLFFPHPIYVLGGLLWAILLAVIATDWFSAWLARDAGYPSLAANGVLLGLLLGLGYQATFYLSTGPGDFTTLSAEKYLDYLLQLFISGFVVAAGTALSLLAMLLGVRLAVRLRLGRRSRTLLSFGLAVGVLLVIGLVLSTNF